LLLSPLLSVGWTEVWAGKSAETAILEDADRLHIILAAFQGIGASDTLDILQVAALPDVLGEFAHDNRSSCSSQGNLFEEGVLTEIMVLLKSSRGV
jgi:hypothetical protein